MKQEQSGELKASLGANKLSADQLRIRQLERELSIAKTDGVAYGVATRLGVQAKLRHLVNSTRCAWLLPSKPHINAAAASTVPWIYLASADS